MWPDKVIRRRLALLGAVTLLLGAAIWLPEHLARGELRHSIEKDRYALGINPGVATGLGQWYEQVVALRSEISGAQQYVPEEDELADVLRGVTEALRRDGVSDPELVTRPVEHYVNYSVIPAGVQVTATFPSMFEVLSELERMPRLIRIDRLEMELSRDDPRQLEVALDLSTFFSKARKDEERNP
jgi:Tfp pilus assembly protein PilO